MSKFSPTPAELALVSQIFNKSDTQKLGILTGDVAVKVFGGAKLSPTVLGEIWSIADEDNNGWLPRKGVAIALRLMGWAQKGETITPDLIFKPGPPPEIEGYAIITHQVTDTPVEKSSPPSLPFLTAQEKVKFLNIFTKAGPDANGLLSGNTARDIFLKSKLSNDTLLQIWNLADTQDRGALDSTDFAIAMYFIQVLMSGQLTFVPTSLPPGLYQQAGGSSASNQGSVRSHMTGNSGSFSPLSGIFPQTRSTIQPQYTGQSQLLQPNHAGFSATSSKPPALPVRPNPSTIATSPFAPRRNGQTPQWDLTPEDTASADKFFNELDTARRGYIEGDVAVPFLLKSNLPGEELARVWDLADINNDGKLTRDGFATAMYLIQRKIAGVDLPNTLPLSLVPPSLRSATASSPSTSPQRQVSQEPARDLLWDDTPPASATVPPPHHAVEAPVPAPPRFVSGPVPINRDPFGSSSVLVNSTSNRDLLSDDDDTTGHASPPLQDRSAEIGNTQNQLHSTNRALDTLKNERAQSDERLASQKSQLESLQAQLATAKTSYETETKTLASIRERYLAQTADIQKLREELIRAESDLSALRVEKAEVEQAYLRDKEDTRELQRKMTEVSQLTESMKAEVEKAKKDAKQQKGLLAIAKKQLTTKEAEKAKAEKELEEAAAEVTAITKERTDAQAELAAFSSAPVPIRADSTTFAANHPLPSSPDRASPAPSTVTGKSNNPFDKLQRSDATPRSQSPFLPFVAGSLPTPSPGNTPSATSAINRASSFDPFGFTVAFEAHDSASNGAAPSLDPQHTAPGTSTPKPIPLDERTSEAPQSIISPGTESDYFVTPPTTATPTRSLTSSPGPTKSNTDATTKFPALDNVTPKFSNLDVQDPTSSTHADQETDSGPLKELDVNESDSDSEDEIPLADLAVKANASPKRSSALLKDVRATSEASSFDDVFGVGSPSAEKSSVGAPATNNSQPVTEDSTSAGVSAFDEAMGIIPSSATPNRQTFTFDSAFDDNFDFDSPTNKPSPPPPTSAITTEDKNTQEFDSIFAPNPKVDVTTFASPPEPSPSLSITNGHAVGSPSTAHESKPIESKPTFDEAFSGFDSGPSLTLDSSFAAPASKPATIASPFLSTSPATPPQVRPISPPAPSRTRSPKLPRPSTSSSKETHEKVKESAPRHSKLSIRLPFGKKKKQQAEPLPSLPAQHLSPPREESTPTATPATDNDVEAVKQLTAMGFSRSVAIEALEKYDYDVQRALNNLLGST
ncbi:hypothetical protein C0995_001551 [Termitomyces sp. Mi166|nr:hypothetical protein C0995_001551 [Termitomyces sp. Mi166\